MLTEPKRPQLEQVELHQLKWLLGTLLGLLSAWTVPYMDIPAWPWLVLITLAAGLVLWRPALGARLPPMVHRLAFPVILAVTVVDAVLTRDILPPLVRLTLLLLLYRMVTPRGRRDDLQLALMGLFLVVVAGVLSVSVVFVAQILLFTACALLFLLTVTLAGAAGSAVEAARPDWSALARRARAATDWRVALLGGGLFAGLVGVSVTFFLLLPRFELTNSLFLENLMKGRDRTGFSESVQLGDVTDLQNDDSVAFRADVSDPAQAPVTPYWRMLVLDHYSKGGFNMSTRLKNQLLPYPGKTTRFSRPDPENLPRDAASWTIYFEAGTSKYLPLPGDFSQIIFSDPQDVQGSKAMRLVALQRLSLRMLPYRVDQVGLSRELVEPVADSGSAQDSAAAAGKAGPPPDYLGLPAKPEESADIGKLRQWEADMAKLRQWAAEISPAGGDPDVFARAASLWLARRHSYSMQVKLPGDPEADPIVRWLGTDLPGHCEFFAGSFVLLARAAGYPARLLVGFKGGLWNRLSGNFVVLNKNAHAWAEILDPRDSTRRRWLRVDPTVGADALGDRATTLNDEAALGRIAYSSWDARLDSLRVFWYRRVVSFDKETRAEVAKAMKESVSRLGQSLKDWALARLKGVREWAARPWDWQRLVIWVSIVAGAFALKRVGRVARLAWLRRRGGDPVRREAGRWLARLAGRGVSGVEPSDHGGVRAALERLRYGAAATWPDPAKVFRAARRAHRAARRG
jgi:transglutaminase-like putative cysteine protease/uncharacterized membrane protein